MNRKTRILTGVGLLVVATVWFFWPHGGVKTATARNGAASTAAAAATNSTAVAARNTAAQSSSKLSTLNTNKLAYRLSNTTDSIRKLEGNPHAILLANAFIDTDKPLNLKIPSHLRSTGNPGAYIVQARGATDARFREMLQGAGAEIVSYIPNNAYLVNLPANNARALAGSSLVQSVLPYEPYYKIQSSLLGLAVNQEPLPPGTALTVGLFATDQATAEQEVEKLGAKIMGRDHSAFGPVLHVLAPVDWTTLVQSPVVQFVEPSHVRTMANDLSRVTVGISPDTTSPITNEYAVNGYVLTGTKVKVAVNDSGVDVNHPDFTVNGNAQNGPGVSTRVGFLNPIDGVDTNGHGTHVAGIIGGNGAASFGTVGTLPLGPGPNVGSVAQGSITNADFRGKAPSVNMFSLNANRYSDYSLQTNASLVGALISNNSWDYGNGDAEYDLAASSYDAATRDALPFTTGSQPVLFVFAAGNIGGGDDDGQGGSGDTILSPGTAKNVITVGALEQFRNITNVVTTITPGVGTNAPTTNTVVYWMPQTDSSDQVAFYSSRGNVGIGTEGTFGRFKPDLVSPGTFVVSTRSSQWDTNVYFNPTNDLVAAYPNQIVLTNSLAYYTVDVPPTAVGVNITIFPNASSPVPFPPNLPIYALQSGIPGTNAGEYDILTTKDGLSIPPDSGGAITGIQALQGNGFSFAVGNTTNVPVNFDMVVQVFVTNNVGDLEQVLFEMNDQLKPYYRYESGTSMAAADVSGVLALIADYFTNTLALTPSPALMKAVLINGSRSTGSYGISPTNTINYQGWGLDNIQDCVPVNGLTYQFNTPGSSFFVDQNPTNALATGDSHTFKVTIDTNTFAQFLPMQATLVWTDPAGDPAAAIKLVNNLDLIITNLDTGEVFIGNDISSDTGFNQPWNTNGPPNLDTINNVENILLPPMLAGNYSVTVVARDVNVNAVTAQTLNSTGQFAPNVVQDFALVISVGEGEVTNAFTVTDSGIASNPVGGQQITVVTTTNTPYFNQFAGASSPLMGTNTIPLGNNTIWGPNGLVTIGQTNQWHFYIVTNTGTGKDFTNAAFITFDVNTLSIPRMGTLDPLGLPDATRPEADIDVWVSQDPSITNLSPVALSNALAGTSIGGVGNGGVSITRGGTEFVFFTNSAPGQVYYVGVQSQDREAAEYAFLPIFTDIPFSGTDQNGNQIVHGLLLPTTIPTGNNTHPGVTNVFALAITPMVIENVIVTNLDRHQNFGDLFGALSFSGHHVVLNNHDGFGDTTLIGTKPIVYNDSPNRPLGQTNTDGPGTLTDFRGLSALGPWILTVMDNSAGGFTGEVSQLTLLIQPHRDLKQPGVIVSVPPSGWFIDYVDVPPGYTNLTFFGTNVTSPAALLPIQMYERFDNEPTLTAFDERADLINGIPPGNSISIGPPLANGRYFIGLYNPNTTLSQNVFISASLGINQSSSDIFDYTANSQTPLSDDAVTDGSVINIPNTVTQQIVSASVGLVVNSPRISDYTFTLVSPTGQRVLLMENRGGYDTNGAGFEFIYTNVLNTSASGGAAANTNYLQVDPLGSSFPIVWNFFTVPDQMTVYASTNPVDFNTNGPFVIYNTGFTNNPPAPGGGWIPTTVTVSYPPGVSNVTIIMNQFGNPFAGGGDQWNYTAGAANTNYEYLMFTDNTNLATVPIKYAEPPFDFTEVSSNFAFSDLDLATNGNYRGPTNIYDPYGGWSVPTNLVLYSTIVTNGQFVTVTNNILLTNNFVSVVTDPNTALGGDTGASNYLALGSGTITRSLSTIPGHIYNVTFWYRGPGIAGWWRGEGNGNDSSYPEVNDNDGTLIGRFNFPAGEVGQAFGFPVPGNPYLFAGTNTYVQVPASPTLNVGAGGGFSIEGWINPTNLAWPAPLVEWLAHVPTNTAITNIVIKQGPIFNPATGNYYYLLGATNWPTSELWAEELGGHLVTDNTANLQNWVYDTFTDYSTLNRYLWIGLTNNGTGFGWASSSTNFAYTNWLATQPLNCDGTRHFTLMLSPTNTSPGLWALADANGFICGSPSTNLVYGVVEVTSIPTNGVQFWISGTNWTLGITNTLQGCLAANIVDTNYMSHWVISPPGLLTTNVYQHVALIYNTNFGIASLYLNGSNVWSTNVGTFVPKTDGDLLLGRDMSPYTNNFFAGEMDEMSVYNRSLSDAEIFGIYNVSASATNGLVGKFDPAITPPSSLAEALVTFGSTSNVIYGRDYQWTVNSYTFTATSNSMPLTISGIQPGILLDSFALQEAPATNLYYLPEQSLDSLVGDTAAGGWTLQAWDNRVGGFVTNLNSLVNWQLSLVLASNSIISGTLEPQTPLFTTPPAGQTAYFAVPVPAWAHEATNIIVSSSQPVKLLYFNPTNPPTGANPPDQILASWPLPPTSGLLITNGTPQPLLPGQTYYLGVQNLGGQLANVTIEVDFDIQALTNGVPVTDVLTNEYSSVRYFSYDVSTNAYEATFQLLKLSGNADLVVRKGIPLPNLSSTDYGSFNNSTADENIYVLTNSAPVPLSPGRWYIGVFNRDGTPIQYSVLAKELDNYQNPFQQPGNPVVIDLTNEVPFSWTAGPGAALTNFFHFHATNSVVNGTTVNLQGLRFEVYNMSGNGDLTVQTNALPLAPPFFQTSQNPKNNPELIHIFTNSVVTNLAGEWYLGVPNREITNISYTIVVGIETNLYFPAFPDAVGAGGGAVGAGHAGMSSTVYHVISTNDAGPGTLRDAVSSTNRTVVFDIAGTIYLNSPLVITNSYLTIAGQTAPGGIAVAGTVTSITNAHDVVIRDVRFRSAGVPIVIASAVTNWFNGFEGGTTPNTPAAGSYLAGWHIDSGSVDWLATFQGAGTANEGTWFVDLDGSSPGGMSTNIPTVVGTTYTLTFAYCRNPNSGSPRAQVLINGAQIGIAAPTLPNSAANLNWQTTSMVFTATSPLTSLAFHSLDPSGVSGVFLDAVRFTTGKTIVPADGDVLQFLSVSNVIVDHISTSWSSNEDLTVLNSTNVTVQWSIMADSLYSTNNPQGAGSLLRYGGGMMSFYHNLYANNYSGSPLLGDNITLDFVNNVIYNWGFRSGLTEGTNDFDFSTGGSTNQLNYVCNYLIAGTDTANFSTNNYNITNIAFLGGVTNGLAATWIFQTNNFIDSDTNGILNGADTGWGMFTNDYTRFGRPFPTPPVPVDEAFLAYERVLDFAGVNMGLRDSVDTNIVTNVRYQTGRLISSPGTMATLISALPYLDTDQDGIPDFWEYTFTPKLVFVPSNNNDRDGDGYTDLEEYNNWLAAPHALTITNKPVSVDLYQLCGGSGHLQFFLTNNVHGFVYLTNVIGSATNTTPWSNSIAVFVPTNNVPGGTNYYGYASFGFYVTNVDTSAYFGPVPVSVIVSALPIAINSNMPPVITPLISGVSSDPTNYGGSDFYSIVIPPNTSGALFEIDNPTGPMAMAIRHTLPLPSLSNFDYWTNAPAAPANQEIAVLTNSVPVPLAPGTWYMAAVNVSGSNVVYTAKITLLGSVVSPVFFYPTNTTVITNLETVPMTISCMATDLDTPPLPLSFALVNGPTPPPAGMTISNGIISWTPTEAQGPSTNKVGVSVSNGAYSVTNVFTIIVEESNLPPVLPVVPNQLVTVPNTLVVADTATDPDIPVNPLTYTITSTVTGPNMPVIDASSGIITWTPTSSQVGTNYQFTVVVTDYNPWAVNSQSLSATNSFSVSVLQLLPPGQPQTNVVVPNGIAWYAVQVPLNADIATNSLLYATAPVNLWFSTNVPPSTTAAADAELLNSSTGGTSLITTHSVPQLIPGSTYFLGVQNPNSFAITNGLNVTFHLVPVASGFSITQTNINGTNGFLITWIASASDQYHLQWSPALVPAHWSTFNGVISFASSINATNSKFQYFDDGSQTGGFGATRFYRLQLLDSPTNTAPFFLNTPPAQFFAPPSVPFAFTNTAADWDIPAQTLTYFVTNSLSVNNISINPLTGIISWTPNISLAGQTNVITTIVFDNGVPSKGVTNIFDVVVTTNIPPVISSIAIVANGVKFQWTAPTNEQFQVQWTTNLAQPNWQPFPNVITSTTGNFSFVDTNMPLLLMKFYELILLP
jgi:hypothetical protein